MAVNPAFGEFFKKKRRELGLTLREFCRKWDLDPGNVSKMERAVFPPPQNEEKKRQYATMLGIKKGTDDWYTFFDLAAISSSTLPEDIVSNQKLLAALPIIFRTARKTDRSNEDIQKLVEAIKEELH